MKNGMLFFTALLLWAACSKKDPLQQDMNRLQGVWNLLEISGGFAGTGYDANFTKLEMDNDGDYSLTSDEATIQEGEYKLKIEDEQLIIRFVPDGTDNIPFDDFEKSVLFQEDDNKLILSEPCCDLFTYMFERAE